MHKEGNKQCFIFTIKYICYPGRESML